MFFNLNKKRVNKRYVPKLRFKGFDKKFKIDNFSNIVSFARSGGTPKSSELKYYKNGIIPFLSINDLNQKYLTNCNKKITRLAIDETSTFIFEKNNILLSIYATIGEVAINKIDVALPQSILGIKIKNNINLEYFYYLLLANQKKFVKNSQTGSQPNLSLKIVNNIQFQFSTNLKEQEKISSFFNLLDKQISLLENKLKLTEQMKKYYLYKMINIGNKFLFRFNEFKDSSIENSQLASLVKLNKYKQISASELEQLNSKSGNIKLLPSSKDFDWFSDLVDIKDNRVNYGNVITLGRARYANIKKWKGHFISSNNIIIENNNNNNVFFDYLYHLINKNKKKFYIEKTTYPVFSIEIFKEFDCSIPSNINEQIKISDFLNKIDWIELHIKNKIELTKKRKSFYLNNLFI